MKEQRRCEEVVGMLGSQYLRCGAPAVVIIQHRGRTEGPYAMCFECADHNMLHRNAGPVEWLDKDMEIKTMGRYKPL